jgi:hypothetical protein
MLRQPGSTVRRKPRALRACAADAPSPSHLPGHRLEPLEPRLLLTTFGPLLAFPDWNQNGPIAADSSIQWNQFAPIDPTTGQRSYLGCVATALAQIATYWHFPQDLTLPADATLSLRGKQIPLPALPSLLGLPDLGTLNQALADLHDDTLPADEALLGVAVGILVHSDFSSTVTTTNAWSGSLGALGFESVADSFNWQAAEPAVAANIQGGQPAFLVISAPASLTTHAVVVDGYDDSSGTFHVRFGFGGQFDGWYTLPSFGDSGYTRIDRILYNIQPTLAAPDALTATPTARGVQLAWNPVPQALSYQIWRAASSDPHNAVRLDKPTGQLLSDGIAATSFVDASTRPGKTCFYWVNAESGTGALGSGFSTPVSPTPSATHLLISPFPASATAGSTLPPLQVQVLDARNHLVLTDNALVTLSLVGPAGSGSLTAQAVNGLATFPDLTLTIAGAYKLSASQETLSSKTRKLTVSAEAQSAHLSIAPPAVGSSPGGGARAPLVLLFTDQFGNLLKSERSRVTLSLVAGPAGATLAGKTSARLLHGVARFAPLRFSVPGIYTLSASDPALATVPLLFLQLVAPPSLRPNLLPPRG